MNKDNPLVKLWKEHFLLSNIILMVLAVPLLCWLGLIAIDFWTHHGETTIVPNVKGMTFDKATQVLEEADLKAVISDSIYDLNKRPGEVVEIFPKAGAVVKPDREVYLTIVSFSPQQIILDVPVVDQSVKSAIAYLKAAGIKTIHIVRVPSQFPDLVIAMKYNGKNLGIGSKIPVTATITLEVGQIEQPVYESETNLDDVIDSLIDAEESDQGLPVVDIPGVTTQTQQPDNPQTGQE